MPGKIAMKPRFWINLALVGCFLQFAVCSTAQMRAIYYDTFQTSNHLKKISFYSPSQGYGAFTNWLGFTTDSGRTFTKRFVTTGNVDYNGYSVSLPFGITGTWAFSADTVLVYGYFGAAPSILRSVNGGLSFKLVYHENSLNILNEITDMHFPGNGSTGFATDIDNVVRTTDRGQTWSIVHTLTDGEFDRLAGADNQAVYVLSTGHNLKRLYKGTSNGSFWNQVTTPPGGTPEYASFITANKGWLIKSNISSPSICYYTSNGGSSWTTMTDPEAGIVLVRNPLFVNDSTGFGINDLYQTWKTTDSGRVWEPLIRDNTFEYLGFTHNDIFAINQNQFWAGGGRGFLEVTTNQGGNPKPKAYFKIDTAGSWTGSQVKLLNRSRANGQYQWYLNGNLISTQYNSFYTHQSFRSSDTIRLIFIRNGMRDTLDKIQYFPLPTPPPVITSFSPTSQWQGLFVNIFGTDFLGTTAVSFGGVPAASFTVVSTTQIQAFVGNGASGSVSVTTPSGTGTRPGFTFVPPPTVSSFNPVSGTPGTVVTITGSNFNNVNTVKFGGTDAASFVVNSSTSISATVGSGSSGSVSVQALSGSSSLPGFTFIAPISVGSFSPFEGGSGTVMTITGAGFNGATAVKIGGVNASSFTVNSNNSITATVGTGASGVISVTSPLGTANSVASFTYFGAPSISGVSPGSAGQDSTVIINGNFFNPVTAVSFGGVPAQSFTRLSNTQIRAVLGTGASGNISVVSPYGTGTSAGFVFIPKPVVSGFTPSGGAAGTTVVITGNQFNTAHTVQFGGAEAFSFTINSNTQITALIGNGASGAVRVITRGGADSMTGFNFITLPPPVITGISPASGPIGTQVTISGSNFNPTASGNTVYFGAVKAPIVSASATSITVTVPPGTSYEPITVTAYYLTAVYNTPFMVRFSGANIFNSSSFSNRTDLIAGATNNSTYINARDMDGDGKPDLLVTNPLMIYPNTSSTGAISFAPKITVTGNSFFQATGDMDGDGKPDYVTVPLGGQEVKILRNLSTPGNFALAAPRSFATGLNSTQISLGDVNNDGRLDILLGSNSGNTISLFINTTVGGTIQLAPIRNFAVADQAAGVLIADLDNDGKNDLIACISGVPFGSPSLSVFRNTSTGSTVSFAARQDFLGGNGITNVRLSDIDGDGKPDLAIGSSYGATVLRNTSTSGNISFAPKIDIPISGDRTGGISVADFDGDGKPDIACSQYWFVDSLIIFRNTSTVGNPAFAPGVQFATGRFPQGVLATDLDGDGQPDIGAVNHVSTFPDPCTVTIYRNTQSPTTSIDPIINTFGIRYYPNPVKDELILDQLRLGDRWTSAQIMDMNGKLMRPAISIAGQTMVKLNMRNMPAGVYFVQLFSLKAGMARLKVVVE